MHLLQIVDIKIDSYAKPMDLNNLVNIWGKHVSLLNDLLIRFEMSMINDLFEFFKQPFLSGMVYDKFPSLMEEIRELFLGMEVQTDKTIADSVVEMLDKNNWKILNDLQNIQLRRLLHDSILVSEIEDKVLEYIQKNRIHLPMYAYPSLVGRLLRSHKQTPLFSK
ncbi:hypothetical protein HHI36_008234 [Cryptolaemus montrouzieri]|uniref:CFAP61 dimerisation domain-containing protein n=1 Tax=Cryptolaemus montrouzieri TaxID=559131 RepID=A0ABD2MS07_9CUCU